MDENRRLAFGGVAAAYDRARPTYPAALVDDVIALAGGTPLRAVEVGAGTGKATRMFAERGAAIDAIEPSEQMAAVGALNLEGFAQVRYTVVEFERWTPEGEPRALVYSAQAWHWIDTEVRCARARACLAPGGVLAAFWNRGDWVNCSLSAEIDAVYAEHAPQLLHDSQMRPARQDPPGMREMWDGELDRTPGLGDSELRSYLWEQQYTAAEYTEMIGTHSDHILLEAGARERLLDGVAAVIEAAGGIRLPYLTHLCLARAS